MLILEYITVCASLVGVVLNIKKRKECFYIWGVTNTTWVYVDYNAGLNGQAGLFAIYTLLAMWGIWEWKRD